MKCQLLFIFSNFSENIRISDGKQQQYYGFVSEWQKRIFDKNVFTMASFHWYTAALPMNEEFRRKMDQQHIWKMKIITTEEKGTHLNEENFAIANDTKIIRFENHMWIEKFRWSSRMLRKNMAQIARAHQKHLFKSKSLCFVVGFLTGVDECRIKPKILKRKKKRKKEVLKEQKSMLFHVLCCIQPESQWFYRGHTRTFRAQQSIKLRENMRTHKRKRQIPIF